MVRRQTSQTAPLAPAHEDAHQPNAVSQATQRSKARAVGSLSALATPLPQHGAGVLAAPHANLACNAIRVRRGSPTRGLDVERRKHLTSPGRGAIAASLGAHAVSRVKDRFVALPPQDSLYRMDEGEPEAEDQETLAAVGPIAAAAIAASMEQRGRITVVCVADNLDLELLETVITNEGELVLSSEAHPEVMYVQTRDSARGGPTDVFFFDYGVVACWGLTQKQEETVIAKLARPCQLDPLSSTAVQTDEFEFHYSANEPPHIKNDVITINRRQAADHRVKLSISHALAQCAKLSVCEERVMDLVGEVRHLPEAMAEFGEIRMSRKQVAQLMGKVFLQKSAVNLLSSVLDTPEYFWTQPDSLQALYRRSCEYLDLTGRIELVNSRFEVLQNMLDIWRDHANHTHLAKLDTVIIWLIVMEVVLAGLEVIGYIGWL